MEFPKIYCFLPATHHPNLTVIIVIALYASHYFTAGNTSPYRMELQVCVLSQNSVMSPGFLCVLVLVPAAELPISFRKSKSTWISRVAPFALTVSPIASLSSVLLTSLWVQLLSILASQTCVCPMSPNVLLQAQKCLILLFCISS